MPKIVANGLSIYYQQTGQGSDVILIHGATGDLSGWYINVMPALASEFRVTAYDLRGHGYSEMTSTGYTAADLADDLHSLLDSLEIAQAHLVGYSFGGSIALQCAARYPTRVASLALAEPWVAALQTHVDIEKWPHREAAKERLRQRGLVIPEEKWFDLEYLARRALQAKSPTGLRRGLERSSRRLLRLLDTTTALKEVLEVAGLTVRQLAEINQPTLAIYGEFSPLLMAARHLEAAMPNCRVVVVDGVAHYFPVTNQDLLVEVVRPFLREVSAPGSGHRRWTEAPRP